MKYSFNIDKMSDGGSWKKIL